MNRHALGEASARVAGWCSRLARRGSPAGAGLVTALWLGSVWGAAPADPPPFRIGFSAATFGDVNENDASAAVRAWAQSLARERGIPADPEPRILRTLEQIEAALTNRFIDAVNLTTKEYSALRGRVRLEECVVAVKGDSITEEYVLLVHRDSGVTDLRDLRGKRLGLLQSARASLAPAWLGQLLIREGGAQPNEFFGQISSSSSPAKVALPVYFRQAEACVVTRSGWGLLNELNPQVGQQLKVLAASPPVVPVLFCFRADYTSPVRYRVLKELEAWHSIPAGRQILTLFQSDRLEVHPLSCLEGALALLAEPGVAPEARDAASHAAGSRGVE